MNEMNEILLLPLGIVGIFAIVCSFALLAFGKTIDQFPVGDETKRSRSIASPVETTKLSVLLFWPLFIIGSWALLQENRYVMVAGMTTLFSICLFMITALGFSFAVFSAMRGKRKGIGIPAGMPVIQISSAASVPVAVPQAEQVPAPVIRKRYNNPVTDFMLNALLKKE
jgi:hypothetical protein